MNSVTLLPNKTLLWKECRNGWVFFSLLFVYITFVSSYTLLTELSRYKSALADGWIYPIMVTGDLLAFHRPELGLFFTLLVVVMAAVMIGQERDQGTFGLLLAMPYSRREVLYHKFLLGLGLIVAAFGVNALVMSGLYWGHPGVPIPFEVADIWAWALRNMVVLAFVFAFTILISTLSGTSVGNGILSMIFLFFPIGMVGLIIANLELWHLGNYVVITNLLQIGTLLTVPSYIIDGLVIESCPLSYVYAVLVLVTLGTYQLAQYLFARNPMEHNGEVLMFNGLEWFFKLGVAVCFALLVVPVTSYRSGLESTAGGIYYLVAGGIFWGLVTWLINWRRKA